MGDELPKAPAKYVSRAGTKLEHALRAFGLDVTGLRCADFGCHAGGFTDCLLRHGAAAVYAIDTGYGVLDYRLRRDPRVIVMERTNALHCEPREKVSLVTIDLGWTRQRHAIPAALRWLAPGGRIISLVKPHYELEEAERSALLQDGLLAPEHAERVLRDVLESLPRLGAVVLGVVESPLRGAKSARRRGGSGNREYLLLAARSGTAGR